MNNNDQAFDIEAQLQIPEPEVHPLWQLLYPFWEWLVTYLGGGDVGRRRFALILSLAVPPLNFFVLAIYFTTESHLDPHFAAYLSVSVAVPLITTALCIRFLPFILATRARNHRVVWIEILSPALAIAIAGFLVFFGIHRWEAYVVSLLLIVWGWSLEVALGFTTQLGLTNSTSSVASGYANNLGFPVLPHVALMAVPVLILSILKAAASYFQDTWFPPPPPPPPPQA